MKKLLLLLILMMYQVTWSQEQVNDNITLCWDTSYSMLERNLEKEFEILDKIIKRTPNQTIQLLLFNIQIEEYEYSIENANWEALKQKLIASKADGATLYDGLEEKIKNKKVYFFTDGNALTLSDNIPVKKGNYIINSVQSRNKKVLERAVLIGKGRLMDLAEMAPENIEKKSKSVVSNNKKGISGTVYIDNVPSDKVEVRIKGTTTIYNTDVNGKFNLPAVPGDSVLITSRSNRTMKTIPIGYFTNNVDVFLERNITTLDEVVVTEKRIETISKEMVTTANGLENKESIGYAVQSIDDKNITEINTDVSTAVSGRMSGVNLGTGQDITTFSTRANTSMLGNNYGLIIVDGTPIQRSNSSAANGFGASGSFIDPNNIAEITVLKGFAATNRYGSEGNNGVLLITTKNAIYGKGGEKTGNAALATNNVYDPDAQVLMEDSAVIKELKAQPTPEKAYEKYLVLRNYNENDDSFYLEAFSFFKDNDQYKAARIISNLWEKNYKDESYLRMTQMAARYLGMEDVSIEINKELNQINPLALQPFFTEAKIKLAQGETQEALNMLSTLENGGAYNSLNVLPIKKTLDRELKNIVFRKRQELDIIGVKAAHFKNEQINVRLLVEWSNPKAEFQIQFVNPQNRFFNWEHTSSADPKRIQQELELGYTMEEFEVYDDLKGDWTINASFIGNLDMDNAQPLILLCTVYTNFGYPSQQQEKILIHLNKKSDKKRVISLKI